MRREEKRRFAGLHDLGFEEMAERRSSDGVKAAGRFIEEEYTRTVEECAGEAEALNRAGRKGAHLAIKRFGEFELRGELRDAITRRGYGDVIEAAEEEEIFAGGEARIEALVGAGVIAERAAYCAGRRDGVMPGNGGAARGREEERGENTEERGFAGTVRAEKGDGFAGAEFEGYILHGGERGAFEWLEKCAQAGTRGRKEFGEGLERDGAIGHREVIARPRRRNNLGEGVLIESGHRGTEVAG
jgi:hypothetical protein